MIQAVNTILIFTIFGLAIYNSLLSQTSQENPCYFDEYTNNNSIYEAESIIQKGVEALKINSKNTIQSNKFEGNVKTIPVVVHVLHLGGAENISLEQIESQMTIMNEDFRKISGTNGDGSGVDTKVEFCLAKIDPYGNCTDGVVRIHTPLTNHQTFQRAKLKELSFWDNTKYMNIYLVKSIGGGNVLGYSSFPGGPPDEDGMVIRSNVFGNIGTASPVSGRTASHEIGHWFGLYHTFNGGCGDDPCTDGDFVCDTPPQAMPNYSCVTLNTCTNDDPDIDDLEENYMNYTPGTCRNMFTEGQKLRMQSTLETIRTNIWSESNLIETGCDTSYTPPEYCGVVADFVTLTKEICIGGEVDFIDISLNMDVSSMNINSWQWTFEGGTPSSSTLSNPSVTYQKLGTYSVKLVVSSVSILDSISSIDSLTKEKFINVSSAGIGVSVPYREDFDSGTYPPQDITINNPDGGVTWVLDSVTALGDGYSLRMDNLNSNCCGSADEIVLPYLDLSTNDGDDLAMTFDWAYARSDPSFSDEMIVLLSVDCGTNFTQIQYKTKASLSTAPTQTTPFIPDSSQWKPSSILLNSYSEEQYVMIKIVNINDGGNNLYIDNIRVGKVLIGLNDFGLDSEFSFYPSPASDFIILKLAKPGINNSLKIYSSLGELLLLEELANQREYRISTQNLNSGIYYIEIISGGIPTTKKLIISR